MKNKININEFGEYLNGLTNSEIKEYLNNRYYLKFKKRLTSNKAKKLYDKFWDLCRGSTCTANKKNELLIYRHDVERFADCIFLGKSTYFD